MMGERSLVMEMQNAERSMPKLCNWNDRWNNKMNNCSFSSLLYPDNDLTRSCNEIFIILLCLARFQCVIAKNPHREIKLSANCLHFIFFGRSTTVIVDDD